MLRWLALIVGGAASLMGLVWTLRCIFRPWMREAAREAADGLYEAAPGQRLPAAMKGLMDRIERVDARRRGDRAAMEPSSISGAVIPPVVAGSVKRGTAVDTARVLQRHASKLTGARVQGGSTGARAGGGSIVRGGQVLGSLGPSRRHHDPGWRRRGLLVSRVLLGGYGRDHHVVLLYCGSGGGGGEDDCTEDQEAIAEEYADEDWPCDVFTDYGITHGDGTHGHDAGYLSTAFISGSATVFSEVAADGVSGAFLTSDWRCPMGNAAVGGSGTSSHMDWRAGDFDAPGFDQDMHATFDDEASTAGAAWWSGYGTGYNQYTGYIHINW